MAAARIRQLLVFLAIPKRDPARTLSDSESTGTVA
jgi:hypothetical protein